MVAAYSTQDQQKLQLVAGSMRDAFGTSKESRSPASSSRTASRPRAGSKNARQAPAGGGRRLAPPRTDLDPRQDGLSATAFDRGFALAAASLRQALQDMPEIAELSRTSSSRRPRTGLERLARRPGRPLHVRRRLESSPMSARAGCLQRSRRRCGGCRTACRSRATRARPGPARGRRAPPGTFRPGAPSACARSSPRTGVPDDRFAAVTGKADTEPMFQDNPYLAANRRVTVTLLKEAPPIPFGTKP